MLAELRSICNFIYLVITNKCRFINILPRQPQISSDTMGLLHTDNNFIDFNNNRYVQTEIAVALMLQSQEANESTFSKLRKNSVIIKFKGNSFNETCGICIEKMNKGDITRELECSHSFHIDCIDQWFEKKCCCPFCNKVF
jgi:hypothetical protein